MAQEPSDVPVIPDWTKLLDGKVAVVTGGGDGIGGAISRLFAEHGAKVEIAEIDPERAERKQAEITDAGGTACAHVVDVRVDCNGEALLAKLTRYSIAQLHLKPGMPVFALVKSVAFDRHNLSGPLRSYAAGDDPIDT